MPIDSWLDKKGTLTEWVWMAHNQVNKRLGKPEITMADFYQHYRQMAERGLPIPPSSPTAEITDAAVTAAMMHGILGTLGAIAVIGGVGGLLWASYKK
jgi:hypothetical protein